MPLIQAPKDWIPQNLMSGSRQRRGDRKPPLPSPASLCQQGQHGRPIPHSSRFLDSAHTHTSRAVCSEALFCLEKEIQTTTKMLGTAPLLG